MEERLSLIDVRAHRDRIGPEIDRRIAAVVEHGRWIMGPEVAEFESSVVSFLGNPGLQAIGCSNGTDALMLALQALGLRPGDAVICPAFTFVATAEAIAMLGGIPVFADVEPDGYNLCPESVRSAIKHATDGGLEVVGIMGVGLFGLPANYDALTEVAAEIGAWTIDDAAQSFGAQRFNRTTGSMATITTTSFFPAKPLGCYGDGGMVFTEDESLSEAMRSLRVHGKGSHKYDNVRIGQNSRLDTMQAAILGVKLSILADELEARERIAARYCEGLADVVGIPDRPVGSRSSWAQYTVITEHRDHLQSSLNELGIDSAVYYPRPLHRQTGYAPYWMQEIDLTRSEWLSDRVISLPMHPYLAEEDVDRVVEATRTCIRSAAGS